MKTGHYQSGCQWALTDNVISHIIYNSQIQEGLQERLVTGSFQVCLKELRKGRGCCISSRHTDHLCESWISDWALCSCIHKAAGEASCTGLDNKMCAFLTPICLLTGLNGFSPHFPHLRNQLQERHNYKKFDNKVIKWYRQKFCFCKLPFCNTDNMTEWLPKDQIRFADTGGGRQGNWWTQRSLMTRLIKLRNKTEIINSRAKLQQGKNGKYTYVVFTEKNTYI